MPNRHVSNESSMDYKCSPFGLIYTDLVQNNGTKREEDYNLILMLPNI